jgi:hypothetical protein
VAAFLRGINSPPLIDLDIILAAVPPDMSMAYLTLVAQKMGGPVFVQLRDDICKALKVKRFTDQLSFTAALEQLVPPDA